MSTVATTTKSQKTKQKRVESSALRSKGLLLLEEGLNALCEVVDTRGLSRFDVPHTRLAWRDCFVLPLEQLLYNKRPQHLAYRSHLLHLLRLWQEEPQESWNTLGWGEREEWLEYFVDDNLEARAMQKISQHTNMELRSNRVERRKIDLDALLSLDRQGEHADLAVSVCRKCRSENILTYLKQTRSPDEPETRFFICQEEKCPWSQISVRAPDY